MGTVFSSESDPTKPEEMSKLNKMINFFGKYVYKSFIFTFVFLLFTINIIAVSISLQCNKNEGIFFKISSALFAFMFGIFYIIMNYYMYRVQIMNNPCVICNTKIFGF